MTSTSTVRSLHKVESALASRVVSIDIFRGLTIMVMIFVNELAEVRGLPWWTYHAHANQDVMTYVDMVFPFFLFIVGMAMPLSIEQRLKRNASLPMLWLHVFIRSASLIVLGLILANAEKVDSHRTGVSGALWGLCALIFACLYLNVYSKSERLSWYAGILRAVGLIGVFVAFVIFRRTTPDGHATWIDPGYPEILGLIGYTYLAAAVLYIPTRRWRWAAPVWLVLSLALCVATASRVIVPPRYFEWYVWPFSNGAMVCLVMAGVVTSQIFFGLHPIANNRPAARNATFSAISFALLALAAGWLSAPLGISKIRATPAWVLWNIGAAVLAFTFLYWICDRRGHTAWASLVRPAGSNTLLTYLLPDLWYFLLGTVGLTYFDTHFAVGWTGVIKSVVFTLLMLAFASILTRARIRLQL
jgi:heparan-alpha-glucosaminide N-acetyltransferase